MFKSHIYLTSALLALGSFIWIGYLSFKPGSSPSFAKPKSFSPSLTGEQARKQVRKDIWIAQSPKDRLHNRIESDNSLLILQPKGDSLEVIEKLQGVRCWIQEKIYTTAGSPIQQIRFFLADEGIYRYHHQNFQASDVTLSMYKIPGINLPWNLTAYNPFLKGIAEEVTFSIQKGVPLFQATHFKASLGSKS